MESIAKCIKETGNWSDLSAYHRFDHPSFSPDKVVKDIDASAPKLKKLIDNIAQLDAKDMKKHGKVFKHFIYSDVKSAYGAKLIASALASNGFIHAYELAKSPRGMTFRIKDNLDKHDSKVFATLTSVLFFEKPIGIRFRKELLGLYNSRPDNIYGEHIRFIILDSGFREGVDLFDVKYVHLFEPSLTRADEKQAIGRATRFCGQKGLPFDKHEGWPIYVYRYETIVPKSIRQALLSQKEDLAPANSFFDLFMRFSNIDPRKITFANELEPLVIFSAVDRYLTRHVHNFKMEDFTQHEHFQKIFEAGSKSARKLPKFQQMQRLIRDKYQKYMWPPTKIQNGCVVSNQHAQNNKDPSIITFSHTQDFVRHFFTNKSDQKGMLLMHSVGTGKTCSAIAVASSSFEKDGWTILYVTKHTLKGDVWKNMFGQTCSVLIQDMIKKGIPIPEAEAKRNKLINAWLEPMSYKQFSNMLQGKNAIYNELVKRNGKEDVLKKTLIVIDEAHKLYAPDVVGTEKPDMDVIKKALMHSYTKSGNQSAKLLLMTATPYTDDPIDMMRLLNLLRSPSEQLPENFENFQSHFLDETGKFTDKGRQEFIDEVTGYVSYLNRERDVRSFSYAVVEDVKVPMSGYEFEAELKAYIKQYNAYNNASHRLSLDISDADRQTQELHAKLKKDLEKELTKRQESYTNCMTEFDKVYREESKQLLEDKANNMKACKDIQKECEKVRKNNNATEIAKLKELYRDKQAGCKNAAQDCKEKIKNSLSDAIADLKEKSKKDLKDCKRGDTECKEAIKDKLQEDVSTLKAKAKDDESKCKDQVAKCKEDLKEELAQQVNELKEDLKFDLKECTQESVIQDCMTKVNTEYENAIKTLKDKNKCAVIKDSMKTYEDQQKVQIKEHVDNLKSRLQSNIDIDKGIVEKLGKQLKQTAANITTAANTDKSQQTHLEKCLKKHRFKPTYQNILNGKLPDFIDEDEEEIIDDTNAKKVKSNVYIIHGHGSEDVVDFGRRMVMPEDKVLVVFPVCGRPNWMNIACKFTDIFNDTKYVKYMMDPVRYQDTIEKILGYPIRIYLPGDKVPFMSTNLFFNFDKEKTVVMKSGVFEMGNVPPINRTRLPETNDLKYSLGDKSCFKYIGLIDDATEYTGAVHHEVFKGNMYKQAGIRDTYKKLESRRFDVQKILEEVGPGIYYYTGCRSSSKNIKGDVYEKILGYSAAQQDKKHRRTAMREFAKKHVKVEYENDDAKPNSSPSPSPSSKSSPKSKSKSKSKSSPKSKSNSPSKSVERRLKKEQRQQLRNIKNIKEKTLSIFEKAVFDEANRNDYIEQCKDLKKQTEDEQVISLIDDILDIIQGNVKYDLKLEFSKSGKVYNVSLLRTYKRKYKVVERSMGVIPVDFKDVKNKCNSTTITRRLKTILKKNKLGDVSLPQNLNDWENDKVTDDLCKHTRKLVTDKTR